MISNPLDTAILAAERGAEVLRSAKPLASEAEVKESSHSVVTRYDLAAQDAILTAIREREPEATFVSEETVAPNARPSPPFWVVDPLDGTSYFVRGLQTYSISVALVTTAGIAVGVVVCPATNELFCTERGAGAYLNGVRIHTSEISKPEKAIVTFGHRFLREMQCNSKRIEVIREPRSIRAGGSCAQELAYLAAGRIDAVIVFSQSLWDYAAGALLVEEAGGRVTGRKGEPLRIERIVPKSQDVIASNGRLHPWCLTRLQGV